MMWVRAFIIFVVYFASSEASEEPDSRFLKTYTGDTNYNVEANNEGVKALMILRQPIEAVPETQTYRTSESSRGNASETDVKSEHQQMWNEPPGSLNYLIAKLEADTPRPKIHFNPVYDEFVKRNVHPSTGFTKGHKMTSSRTFFKRNFDPIDSSGFRDFSKRNFDPIDSSGFRDFNKRNFDPIDRSGFSDFNKRNFDPIDRSGFSDFLRKRSAPVQGEENSSSSSSSSRDHNS